MPKILVVDDEATITTQLEERLSRMGYDVVGAASTGEEAVEIAERLQPDIILMDIVMPGKMDGIQAAEEIRKKADIPVIFLTAYGDDSFIARAKKAEPFGYLMKPYQDEGLKAAVEVALYNKTVVEKLKKSERHWQALVDNIHEGIIVTNERREVIFWNRGAEGIFKYSREEALGKPLTFILSEGIRSDYERAIERVFKTGDLGNLSGWLEVIGVRKDFSRFSLELTLNHWELQDRAFMICLARDVTDRKRTEESLKSSLITRRAEFHGLARG